MLWLLIGWRNLRHNQRTLLVSQQNTQATLTNAQEVESRRAQDAALQAYFEQIGDLLLDKKLRSSREDSAVRILAQAQTHTVLPTLNWQRKRSVLIFLYKSMLLNASKPIIGLIGADLSGADLSNTHLREINLCRANLYGANLPKANLYGANLPKANLYGANLQGAYLVQTNLQGNALQGANRHEADLEGADLEGADLRGANLLDADFQEANLTNAEVAEEPLQEAKSLEGAIMPTGQKYEDCIKDRKGRGEDEANSGGS